MLASISLPALLCGRVWVAEQSEFVQFTTDSQPIHNGNSRCDSEILCCRAVQSCAAAMIVSELRQLSGCFPKSSTVHGRPECSARGNLSSICLLDSFIVIAADLSRRLGGFGSMGNAHDRRKLGPAGHVGCRGPTV